MKIIFLDVDGVLNSSITTVKHPRGFLGIDNKNLSVLKKIIDITKAKIVLSSTWRINHAVYVHQKLVESGINGGVFSVTDRFPYSGRGTEILTWVREHNINENDFVVIDDIVIDEISPEKIVYTEYLNGGLKESHIEEVVYKLGIDNE